METSCDGFRGLIPQLSLLLPLVIRRFVPNLVPIFPVFTR